MNYYVVFYNNRWIIENSPKIQGKEDIQILENYLENQLNEPSGNIIIINIVNLSV